MRCLKQVGVAIGLSAAMFFSSLLVFPARAETPPAASISDEDAFKSAHSLSAAFERVANIITPSVVNISAVSKPKFGRKQRGGGAPGAPDPLEPFRDFFGEDFAERFGAPPGSEGFSQQGLGTGVVVDNLGHILTNNHVVANADEVNVRVTDGRIFKAKVIGTDPRSDIAVIEIKEKGIPPAKLGSSSELRIGEWVIAAGNPFGLDNTITAGIVSAKGRSFMGGGQYEDFIQTDAAINPGNSGGPLVNLRGEVVGINTAIFSRSGGYMGIGFAIPIDMAKTIMNSLITGGKVIRGYLGVSIQPLTQQAARHFGYSKTDGILVGGIEEGGPADDGGIKQGDIILSLNDEKVKDVNQLRNTVASFSPGKTVSVRVHRKNEGEKTFKVKVGELPTESMEASPEASAPALELGISAETLTAEVAQRIGSKKKSGVVVNAVKPGSLAESAGLRPRDVVVSVNGSKISNLKDFEAAIKAADIKKGLSLVVETQGMEHFVFLGSDE